MNIKKVIQPLLLSGIILSAIALLYTHAYKSNNLTIKKAFSSTNIVPVLIIGSGPAGLSAGLYTARAQFNTIILTGNQPGGQLAEVKYIENWPAREKTSGITIMDDLKEQVEHFGAHVIYDTAVKVDLTTWPFTVLTENELTLHPLSIIFATGGIPKKLMVPGVDQYWGKGIGICTLCDAPFNKGQEVAVVGGGDTSAERALQLSAYAKNVLMIVRESELDAIATVQKYVKSAANIKILYNTEILSIEGNNEVVTQVNVIDNKTGKKSTIPLNAIYFAIGYHPNSDLVTSLIKTDKDGYIVVQCGTQRTIIPGFYAAGIVAVSDKPYGKSVVAAGSGIKAAMDVITFLENIGLNPDVVKKLDPNIFHVEKSETSNISTVKSLEELQKILQTAEHKPVLLYVHAPMCPSCRIIQPVVQMLATEQADTYVIVQAEPDSGVELIEHFSVTRVPYFLLFKDGKIIWQGSPTNKQQLIETLKRSLTLP